MKNFFAAGVVLATLAPLGASAQTIPPGPATLTELRAEISALRTTYETRIHALEERLQAMQPPPGQAAAPTVAAAPSPEVATQPTGSSAPASAGAFNPAISLVLSGGYTRTSRDPNLYQLTGVSLPAGTAGPGSRGFSLAESELGLAANIDPWLRGAANISLHADNTLSVEEAFVQTTSLGSGLSLKAGRFYSSVGYLNSQHSHTWDFADNPLAYQAFLGTQYGDDGVQLSWLAPTDRYIELAAEVGRGRSFPGTPDSRNGAGMAALSLHTGGDVGFSNNWRAGVSVLNAKANLQSLESSDAVGSLVNSAFSGSTRVLVLDGVWKWAPNGNATQTNFKLQGEYLQSTRTGSLTYDPTGVNSTDAARLAQSGWYLQAVYQFMPRWRVGLRTERINPGSPNYGVNTAALDTTGYRPSKNSLMLDYSPSEFSRVRLQLAQDRSRLGKPDNQLFLTYQMSLGAHGAHSY